MLRNIQRRFDAIAIDQLRDEVVKLAARVEALEADRDQYRDLYYSADRDAESWRDDYLDLIEQQIEREGGQVGLCIDGSLVHLPAAADQAVPA